MEVPLPANVIRAENAENMREYTYLGSDRTWLVEFVPEFAPNHVCVITDDRSVFGSRGFGTTCFYKGEE